MVKNFLGTMGHSTGVLFAGLSSLAALLGDVCGAVFLSFFQKKVLRARHIFNQIVLMGLDSLPIICLIGAAVGMVLALQAGYQLKQFGAVLYTGSLVSVSVTRELGPLVASIVITGRVGARMAAELGTMVVQEEVDALKTMGLNPIRYLVVPRVIALVTVLPLLTVIADVMGMIGGYFVGVFGMGINSDLYIKVNFDALVLKDIYTGLAKSCIFAVLISLISCHQGLSVSGGAEGVGKSTTQAVVISIIMIIVMDCVSTAVFYYALPS